MEKEWRAWSKLQLPFINNMGRETGNTGSAVFSLHCPYWITCDGGDTSWGWPHHCMPAVFCWAVQRGVTHLQLCRAYSSLGPVMSLGCSVLCVGEKMKEGKCHVCVWRGWKKRFLLYTVKIKTQTLWFCISRAVFSVYILPPGLCAMQLKMKCSFKLVVYLVWIRTPMSLS